MTSSRFHKVSSDAKLWSHMMQRPVQHIPSQPPPAEKHFRDYLRIVLKRTWIILGLFVSTVTGTALYALMQPAIYDSTVRLLVEPTGPRVNVIEEVYAPITGGDYYKTQSELIKSHQILRETAHRLNLKGHPEYSPRPAGLLDSWLEWVKAPFSVILSAVSNPTGQTVPVPESEGDRQLVEAFKGHVTVKLVQNSRLIEVKVESIDPQLAADAANTIASVYIARSLEMRIGASVEATRWMASRVEELRGKVEESERTLQEFVVQHGLMSVDERRRMVTEKLKLLHSQLMQAEGKRIDAEARFQHVASVMENPRALESSAEALSSGLIQTLRSQEITGSQKVAELSEKYGPKHPALMKASAELKEMRTRMKDEIKKIYDSVKAERDEVIVRERLLRNALEKQKSEVIASGQHEVQYGILERETESNRQLYEMFLRRMKETDIATEIRSSNISVADPAIVSPIPVKPNKRQMVLLAALLSLIGGIGLAFVLDNADSTLKSEADIVHSLPGLAFLGFVPVCHEARKQAGVVDFAIHETPQSLFADQIRSVRTTLMLSAADKPPTSILVTSSLPGEGKTALSLNLAIAFAQLGHPTVLIEGDLRKPRLQTAFGLKLERGLSHYLAGEAELHAILHPTMVPNLKLIPCGAIPPNPTELLQSRHMADLLESFRKDNAHVVVDCAPVISLADSLILGHLVDGAVLVVHAAYTTRQVAQKAVHSLLDGKTKVLGVVLQRVQARDVPAYYSHYEKDYYHPQKPGKPRTSRWFSS